MKPLLHGQNPSQRFNQLDFTSAAMLGDASCWETYAGLGIVGKCELALAGLSRHVSRETQFFEGVTHWISGDEIAAAKVLGKCDSPAATRLLSLINKPQINVLAQLPFGWEAHHLHDSKFKLTIVGDHNTDIQRRPYSSIQDWGLVNNSPDFFLSSMIEWHDIPCDIQELDCPLFGTTADYDAHLHTALPWLKVFDEIVVPTFSEWQEVTKLSGRPVSTFPKLYGSDHPFKPVNEGPRPVDVFISGSVLSPYFREKADLLLQVLAQDTLKTQTANGFTSDYWSLLEQAKATWTFVRRAHGIPSRGIEALCMGCAVVVQADSALQLYADSELGVLTYRTPQELAQQLKEIVNNWERLRHAVAEGAQILRHEFALPRVFSQLLRYLTFRTACQPSDRARIKPDGLIQKDWFYFKGRHDSADNRATRRMHNLARVRDFVGNAQSPSPFIDAARELIIEYSRGADSKTAKLFEAPDCSPNTFDLANQLTALGISQFPRSLALRFNSMRFGFHSGNSSAVTQSLCQATEILKSPPTTWDIQPEDDVLPLDFYRGFFNYREYLDVALRIRTNQTGSSADLTRLILASVHFYVGHYFNSTLHFQCASQLDPIFAHYKLTYAKSIITLALEGRATNEEFTLGVRKLIELATSSELFVEAFKILNSLLELGVINPAELELPQRLYKNFKAGSIDAHTEHWLDYTLRPADSLPLKELIALSNQLRQTEGRLS